MYLRKMQPGESWSSHMRGESAHTDGSQRLGFEAKSVGALTRVLHERSAMHGSAEFDEPELVLSAFSQ